MFPSPRRSVKTFSGRRSRSLPDRSSSPIDGFAGRGSCGGEGRTIPGDATSSGSSARSPKGGGGAGTACRIDRPSGVGLSCEVSPPPVAEKAARSHQEFLDMEDLQSRGPGPRPTPPGAASRAGTLRTRGAERLAEAAPPARGHRRLASERVVLRVGGFSPPAVARPWGIPEGSRYDRILSRVAGSNPSRPATPAVVDRLRIPDPPDASPAVDAASRPRCAALGARGRLRRDRGRRAPPRPLRALRPPPPRGEQEDQPDRDRRAGRGRDEALPRLVASGDVPPPSWQPRPRPRDGRGLPRRPPGGGLPRGEVRPRRFHAQEGRVPRPGHAGAGPDEHEARVGEGRGSPPTRAVRRRPRPRRREARVPPPSPRSRPPLLPLARLHEGSASGGRA